MKKREEIFDKNSSEGIIFISYSTKDQYFADKLYNVLQEQNVPCFLASDDIIVSTNWIKELTKYLNYSWLLLLLITPDLVHSKYVLREVNIAISKDIPIYPVILKPTEIPEEITFLINPYQMSDYSQNQWPEPITLILENIQKLYELYEPAKAKTNAIQSRDREISIDKNRLPPFVQFFDWIEADIPEEVETAVKSLPLPEPIDHTFNPDEWIATFQAPFKAILEHAEARQWLEYHFDKLAYGQRGLTSFVLFDAVLSVPPLARIFDALVRQLEQSWKTVIFAKTGTGKSRLLTYLAHYWRKKWDRPVFFIDHPQRITPEEWNAWSRILSSITDRNTKFPILIIIEDLHSISESTRDYISSFIQQASSTTYAVICTFTVSEKQEEEEIEKQEREYWEKVIHSGTARLERFESYWKQWQPFFFTYLKWMAPTILKRRMPQRWKVDSEEINIFESYQSPWFFVVGLGFLEETFKDEFLSKKSDPLDKALYLLIHVFFLCNNELPIPVVPYIRFLQKGLINLVPNSILSTLKEKTIELIYNWSSREKRLLPPTEFMFHGFEKHYLQPVYHQEWAREVVKLLYMTNSDSDFLRTIDKVLKQVYANEFVFWEDLQYDDKPTSFLNWLIESAQFLGQDNLVFVQNLYLNNKNLKTLPNSIGELDSLQVLGLSSNQLTTLPESIGELDSLQELGLSSNQLTTLPESIGNLSSIKRLRFMGNKITTLPDSIGNLSSLKVLSLYINQLSTLPKSIGNLSSLKDLDLNWNKLMTLPQSIGNLQSLISLNLGTNQLISLPESIGNLTSLKELNLRGNQLKNLPESLKTLKSLRELDLGLNKLTVLPESIGNLSSLEILYLWGNQLKFFPESINKLKSLKNLDISINKLTVLPESIGNLTSLEKLNLSWNKLTTLPNSIGKLASLQVLNLSSTKLTTFPKSITKLKSLKALILGDNNLTTLPDSIRNLSLLEKLYLWNNGIINLPEPLGNLTSLKILVLWGNNLTTLPDSIGNLKSLKELYLGGNILTTLPESIGNLTSLEKLNLRGNQLKTLPESIKVLEKRGVIIYK